MGKKTKFLIFLIFAAGIAGAATYLIHSPVYEKAPFWLTMGLTIDLTLTLCVAFYFLVIRPNGLNNLMLVPVLGAGIFLTHQIIPADQHHTVDVIAIVAGAMEIPFLIYLVWKVYKTIRKFRIEGSDVPPWEVLEQVLIGIFPTQRLAKFAYTDLALMWFALFAWRQPLPVVDGKRTFTHHKTTNWRWMIVVMVPLGLVEAFGLHWILLDWKPWVAWLHMGITIYSILWIIGDWQAIRHTYFEVTEEKIRLQVGLRGRVEFARDLIDRVELGPPPEEEDAPIRKGEFVDLKEIEGYFQMTAMGEAEVTIYLKEETEVEGIFGIRKKVDKIGVAPDQIETFAETICGGDAVYLRA